MHSKHSHSCLTALLFGARCLVAATTPEDIASSSSLTVSTTLPFPTAPLAASDADSFIISSWSLNKNKIQNQPQDLGFVPDPFPSSSASNSTSPVLQVSYPAGSFADSHGGAQFISLFNGSIPPESMLLSYEIAFDKGFKFNKGGKLPGLRGGSNTTDCEGGSKPDGTDCWSTRLMWRENGDGEVYAYIPTPNDLCSQPDIQCNSDFGTSMGRGSFTFPDGEWSRITLFVQLNDPGDVANGVVRLYFNDMQVISFDDIQLRSNTQVFASGLFFSTFFGGGDDSWAAPQDERSYFRNFRMWASEKSTTASGKKVSSAASSCTPGAFWFAVTCVILALAGAL